MYRSVNKADTSIMIYVISHFSFRTHLWRHWVNSNKAYKRNHKNIIAKESSRKSINLAIKLNEWRFRPGFCILRLNVLSSRQPGLSWSILVWIIPQVQDRLLYLMTCSSAHYLCATTGPFKMGMSSFSQTHLFDK